MITPQELGLVDRLRLVTTERGLLDWLGRFESLKRIVGRIRCEWGESAGAEPEGDKQALIREFCLKLGDLDEVAESDKKKVFKVVKLSVKMLKSREKARAENRSSTQLLEFLVQNKQLELRRPSLGHAKRQPRGSRKSAKQAAKSRPLSSKLKSIRLDPILSDGHPKLGIGENKGRRADIGKKEMGCQTGDAAGGEVGGADKLVCFVCFKMFYAAETREQTSAKNPNSNTKSSVENFCSQKCKNSHLEFIFKECQTCGVSFRRTEGLKMRTEDQQDVFYCNANCFHDFYAAEEDLADEAGKSGSGAAETDANKVDLDFRELFEKRNDLLLN